MKKYKVDGYSILAALPYSFQISTEQTSHRLVDHQDDPDAEYPYEITIQQETLSSSHILMYTPRKYMRIVYYNDPEEPNGQIDMGIRTPASSLDFASWLTLTNGVSKALVTFVYLLITSPDSVKEYEVPLFESESSNNSTNNELPPPKPPTPKVTNNGTKKKRKYKLKSMKP